MADFDDDLANLLADPAFQTDGNLRRQELASLRQRMVDAPIDPDFAALLSQKLAESYPDMRMRFRSSTNAEDLGTYSGAGLYTSKTGDPNDPQKPVFKAVKKVWASLYNYRAFEERELLGIAHEDVGMAVLVHRSYPNEIANGVAITANIFAPAEQAFYVNMQLGEVSVTNPPVGVLPDQFLYYWAAAKPTLSYLSHSTLNEGQPILNEAETTELAGALFALHQHFSQFYGGRDLYAMDVELKFDSPDRALVIKQARPYPASN
jgi:hypothetical protein